MASTSSEPGDDARPVIPLRRKIVYALLVPMLLVGLGECALRVKSRVSTGTWDHRQAFRNRGHEVFERHFHLGSVPIAGYEFDDADARVTINSRGFRGFEVAVPKPPGTFRIACLGGSAVFGTRNSADDATWPARLGQLLAERFPERSIEVVNAGCPGYDSLANYINLQCRVLDLEPDLVLVYQAFNDLKINRVGTFRSDHRNAGRLTPDRSIPRRLAEKSLLYLTLEHHLRRARSRVGEDEAWDTVDPAGPRAFRRNLESIAAVCRQHDARLVLATFARPWEEIIPERDRADWILRRFSPAGLARAYEVYNETIRDTAAALGIPLADADRLVPHDESLFADPVHFNDAGAVRMAETVLPVVAPLIPE